MKLPTKKILLDVDGVIADFVSAADVAVRRYTGGLDGFDWREPFEKYLPALNSGTFAFDVMPYPGAVGFVMELCRRGYRPIACTRPLISNPFWMTARLKLLEECFAIPPRDVIFATDKSIVGPDLPLVEDTPENLVGRALGILIARPWNFGGLSATIETNYASGVVSVAKSYQDVLDIIDKRDREENAA